MSGPGHGQHPALEHVRHGLCAAPHGHQRLVQPPHLPVRRAALQGGAVRDAGAQVWEYLMCWVIYVRDIECGI